MYSMTPDEAEFFAEDEFITIVPKFHLNSIHLISGDIGPFQPLVEIEVPIWMGIELKKKQKCQIHPPSWLSKEFLEEHLKKEKSNANPDDTLPFHYIEIAQLLLQQSGDDIEDNEEVRGLLESIINIRNNKIQNGVNRILEESKEAPSSASELKGISLMELVRVREPLIKTLNTISEYIVPTEATDETQENVFF